MKSVESILVVLKQGGLWLFFGHMLTILGQFVLLKLIAIYGSQELFGQFAIVMLVYSGMQILLFGPFSQWAIRHYHEFIERNRAADFYVLVHVLVFLCTVVILLLYSALIPFVDHLDLFVNINFSAGSIFLSIIFGIITCTNDLVSTIFNAAAHPKKATVFFAAGTWLRVGALALIIKLELWNLENIIFFMIIFQLILFTLQYLTLIRIENNIFTSKRKIRKLFIHFLRMRSYVMPFILWGVPGYVALMGDRWVLAAYTDATSVGIYAAMALTTLGLANAIGAAFNKAVSPIIFRASGSGNQQRRKEEAKSILYNLTLLLCLVYLPFVVIYYYWPNIVIGIFTSDQFIVNSNLLWLLMIAAIAFNVSQLLITHGLVEKKPRIYLPTKYFHGALTLTLLLFFVPGYGAKGAIISVTISHVFQLIVVLYVNRGLSIDGKGRLPIERT